MDGPTDSAQDPTRKDYKSRPGALAWFFRKSRDGWKRKYRDLQATSRVSRTASPTSPRAASNGGQGRAVGQRLGALEAEDAELRARMAEAEG